MLLIFIYSYREGSSSDSHFSNWLRLRDCALLCNQLQTAFTWVYFGGLVLVISSILWDFHSTTFQRKYCCLTADSCCSLNFQTAHEEGRPSASKTTTKRILRRFNTLKHYSECISTFTLYLQHVCRLCFFTTCSIVVLLFSLEYLFHSWLFILWEYSLYANTDF